MSLVFFCVGNFTFSAQILFNSSTDCACVTVVASIKIDGNRAIYTPDGNGGLGTITIKNIGYAIYYTMYPVKNGNILCACVSINGIHCQVVF